MNELLRNLIIGTIAVVFTLVHVKGGENAHFNNPIVKLVIEKEKVYKKQNVDIPEAAVLCEAINDILNEKVLYLDKKIEELNKRIEKN